jgi:hypothetical protein
MGTVNNKERKMYLKLMTDQEQEKVVRALKGWQWIRENHGSLYDRGSADSYYGRAPDPHYGGVGGDSGIRVKVMYDEAVAEYMAGYNDNEQFGHKKDYT